MASVVLAATMAAASTAPLNAADAPESLVGVIVRELEGAGDAPERLVELMGGVVGQQLPIIGGFAADLPQAAIRHLSEGPGVAAVTPDVAVRLNQLAPVSTTRSLTTYAPVTDADGRTTALTTTDTVTPVVADTKAELSVVSGVDTTLDGRTVLEPIAPVLKDVVTDLLRVDPRLPGAPANVAAAIGADEAWAHGITGQGIDVAIIDSGVVPVDGLRTPGKVIHGPDLSFEGGDDNVRHLDTYGHGTHMAGVIAGLADGATVTGVKDPHAYRGVAPGARIVSVKVADATGATDVSQVIAAIDWVVQNRNSEGRNIRVLNLSFGTDGAQDYAVDPLAYAAEVAWRNGIVVVASGGNQGRSMGRLMNPAIHPAIIAVGAVDTNGTPATTRDDSVPEWSQRGSRDRTVDVTAPGRSLVSLRSPGSWIDANHATGRVGTGLFKGSGTSQSAAVVSGAAALMLEAAPSLTPDQVKVALQKSAVPTPNASSLDQGAGMIDLRRAVKLDARRLRRVRPASKTSDGSGSLDAARGSMRVTDDNGRSLEGEVTAMGSTWSGSTWAGKSWAGSLWKGSTWSGSTWAGSTWAGSTWAGSTWAGSTWAGSTWAGSTWAGSTWAGSTWAGSTWASTAFWNGVRWE